MGCTKITGVTQPTIKLHTRLPELPALDKSAAPRLESNYEVMEKLGNQAGSSTYKCRHINTKQIFSVKYLNKKALGLSDLSIKELKGELQTLRVLSHPHLVRIVEFFETASNYLIVTEYCQGGKLLDTITEMGQYSEAIVRKIIWQILSTLNYCHQRQVMHRDLSPETVLLESPEGDPVVKIIDFGSMAFFDIYKKLSGRFGTVYYSAPEVLDEMYDERCDLWSCGIIMHVLLMGYPPFKSNCDAEIGRKIREEFLELHSEEYASVSNTAKTLLQQLLTKNPDYRITAAEALESPWFKLPPPTSPRQDTSQVVANLGKFKTISKLKNAIFNFICCHMLSKQDYEHLRTTFLSYDTNGDGVLSTDEIKRLMTNTDLGANIGTNQLNRIVQAADSNGNSLIEYNEFLKAAIDNIKLESKEVLHRTFSMLDKNQDGCITAQELQYFLQEMEDQDNEVWEGLLKEADTNQDGSISMAEFEALIQRKI